MACTTCQTTKKIPTCTTDLVLGTTVHLDTNIYIFVRNLTTGYLHRETAVTDGAGEVILDLSQPDSSFYNPYSIYEVWVTLATSTINEKVTVTIGATGYTCFTLEFDKVYGDGNYTEHILEIE